MGNAARTACGAATNPSKHPLQPGWLARAEEQPGCPTHTRLPRSKPLPWQYLLEMLSFTGLSMSVLANRVSFWAVFPFLEFSPQEELPREMLRWGSG